MKLQLQNIIIYRKGNLIALMVIIISLWGCKIEKKPISFGNDACSFCKMLIVDVSYGAEVITNKGKVYKYDASECMIREICQEEKFKQVQIHSIYVIDFLNPGTLVDAQTAGFLFSEQLPSPMGAFLSGFESIDHAKTKQEEMGGEVFDLQAVKDHIFKNNNCH